MPNVYQRRKVFLRLVLLRWVPLSISCWASALVAVELCPDFHATISALTEFVVLSSWSELLVEHAESIEQNLARRLEPVAFPLTAERKPEDGCRN